MHTWNCNDGVLSVNFNILCVAEKSSRHDFSGIENARMNEKFEMNDKVDCWKNVLIGYLLSVLSRMLWAFPSIIH
jgi:hypothetical protein